MQASDYLKMKFQSDRQLAIYGQQGVAGTWQVLKGIGSDIYSGMERVSWYSSCLIPIYHDACDELLSEEKRMYLSIMSIYRYRDVIAYMLYLYFESVIADSENGNEQNRVRKMDSKVTGLVKNIPTSKAARLTIAWGLAKSLSESGLLSEIVIERLARRVPNVVMALQLIGTEQKCALAARRLKTLDPEYYATLYAAQLEMLYYFFEPFLSELIKKVRMGFYRDFESISNDLKDKGYV
ncbi:hypothetical protein [Leclercia adecarboxylata]|jgi:hypothetical protein|uniref:Uncharacterized protein n=1 Tax=Leclercia adecarboxylata TaxID=83655 RepID=A0ABU6I5W0_9ENTR|nr:hypothetical protein [Leclercia adecarboxylata]MBM6635463.1 hypothetical protein [Leclercia adecarboxylata]MBZ3802364.1 hypothetical protein [Leclercia adecarboxylata]MBZ3806994.1 hypothetical protein [Leclercia adecarboxylata]MCE9983068.1 hypothetical protein [Leclercia adecarboxylata]MDH0063814.1 hypothetical protein [Leclercia adecarboxylata]